LNSANQDQAAFELNGQRYSLVGVNLHQDSGLPGQLSAPEGWAQTAADIQQQVDLVMELWATFVRTVHYEYSQEFYNDADKAGLILQVDGDLQGTITSTSLTSAFVENYEDQLTENVKQNFNHPSIIAYSMFNEIGNSSAKGTLISNLSSFVHSLDPTRYTTVDSNDGSSTNAIDKAADLLGTHLYNGWYGGVPHQMGRSWIACTMPIRRCPWQLRNTAPAPVPSSTRTTLSFLYRTPAARTCIRKICKTNSRNYPMRSLHRAIICGQLPCGTQG
jgi:beta-galactosidase